jgi:hypothetical protein
MFQIGDIVEYKSKPRINFANRKKFCYLIVGLHSEDFYDIISLQDGKQYVLEWNHADYYNKLSK